MKKITCSQPQLLTEEEQLAVNGGRNWNKIRKGCVSNAKKAKKAMDRAREWSKKSKQHSSSSTRSRGCNSRG